MLTLAVVATLIEPARVWLRRWANRVVFGVSLDPQQALRTLSDGLDRRTPAEELDRLTSVALQATRADAVRLWLIDGDGPALRCSRTADQAGRPAARSATSVCAREPRSRTSPSARRDEVLAGPAPGRAARPARRVDRPTTSALPRRDQALLAEIADHAGLLVHNAALTVGLARQADRLAATSQQLRRVRRRLVAAQDEERRRLERDLHDGAQQALVAALIDIGRTDAPIALAIARRTIAMAAQSLDDLLTADRPAVLDELGLAGAVARAAAPLRAARDRGHRARTRRRSRRRGRAPRRTSVASRHCRTSRSTRPRPVSRSTSQSSTTNWCSP